MRIVCPACNAAYQVPDERLGPGKLVRCARCNTDWTPIVAAPDPELTRVAPEAAAPEPVVVEPAVPQRMALEDLPATFPSPGPPAAPAVEVPSRRRFPWLAVAWVASVGLVVAAVALVVVQRERVMQAWPPSVRGYAAVGLVKR